MLPYESDDDEFDRMILNPFHFNIYSRSICTSKPPKKRRRRLSFHVHDDVIIRNRNYQIRDVTADANGGIVYRLIHEHARPSDPLTDVSEEEMILHATSWPFVRVPTRLTSRLKEAADDAGVRVTPSPLGGLGLFAASDLPAGHAVPYDGRLSAIQRDQGEYNCQLTSDVYLIADDPADRGPGALANSQRHSPMDHPHGRLPGGVGQRSKRWVRLPYASGTRRARTRRCGDHRRVR